MERQREKSSPFQRTMETQTIIKCLAKTRILRKTSGRSIDKAVETVYDSFYEALAEGKDVTLLQTDFCKAYDYVNHDALLHILKGLNAPPQAIYVVEKVLRESVTWLLNIGGSKRGVTKESIQS